MVLSLGKIGREIRRIAAQLFRMPGDILHYTFATWKYDLTRGSKIVLNQGSGAESKRIVIYLIYPKEGVQNSHLRACEYFVGKGYAVLAVSNIPLSDNDHALLTQRCWRVMQRPNFGYDFGGYRDAIISLSDKLQKIERLVIFNDSTWFPLPKSRDWLDDAESLAVDFVGAANNFGTPRPEIVKFRSIKWRFSPKHRNFHYCSFAIFMRPAVFRGNEFFLFWKKLRLSDRKNRTVRRGEIGLTQWVLSQGFSHGATLNIEQLDRDIEILSNTRLRDVANELIIIENEQLHHLKEQILADPATTRDDLIKLILLVVSRQGASYALASFSVQERGFPFLKKSPLWLSKESAIASLKILAQITPEVSTDFLSEAVVLASKAGHIEVSVDFKS